MYSERWGWWWHVSEHSEVSAEKRHVAAQVCPRYMVIRESRESWGLRREETNADPTKSFLLML